MAIYPFYTAGQRLTAADLQAGQFQVAYKTVDTQRASTTTLTDDPELILNLDANAIYMVEFFLHYAGPTITTTPVGTIQTAWRVPTGATGLKSVMGLGSAATADNNSSMRSGVHGYATTIIYGTRSGATNQVGAVEESLITTSSSGTLALQWAQNTSNTTATIMAKGSWARALRIS